MIKLLIFAKNIDGGTGTFIKGISELKKNVDINILIVDEPKYRKLGIRMKLESYGGKNYANYPILATLIEVYKQTFWLKRKMEEIKPDVILTIDSHCVIIAQLARQLYRPRTKIISSIHNNVREVISHKVPALMQEVTRKIIKYCLERADIVICVSASLSKDIKSLFGLKIKPKTVYYGVPTSPYVKSLRKNKSIISIGRLFQQKDFFTVIKGYKLLKKRMKKAKLLIVGDGPQKKEIMDYSNGFSLKVRFIDWSNNPSDYLKKSSVFVFSSNWEGFGYVIIEAMSQGLPVIATNTPFGPKEILDNGKYGILVPMKDEKDMAKAMYELLTDEKKYNYYSQKSLERAEYFSLFRMLTAYKEVIFDNINNL